MSHDPEPTPTKWDTNDGGLDPIATIKAKTAAMEAGAGPNRIPAIIPADLAALGCFIDDAGRIMAPKENAAKIARIVDRMQREIHKANRKPDGKPIMVGKIPTKRV